MMCLNRHQENLLLHMENKWMLPFKSLGLSLRFLIHLTSFSTLPSLCVVLCWWWFLFWLVVVFWFVLGFLSLSASSLLTQLPGKSYSV